MQILLVSYFVESHLDSSSAQNTRFLASGLLERGHEVRVVCAGHRSETIKQDGYSLTRIPLIRPQWQKKLLDAWRPDPRSRQCAQDYICQWKPDVLYMGAWQHLSEFVFAAKAMGIPVIQMVHDYSILCPRHWLVDSWGKVCSGPASMGKCTNCVRHGLGWKDRVKDAVLSLPVLGETIWEIVKEDSRWGIHAKRVVEEAYTHLQRYRDQIDVFIAQSPSVIEVLKSGGIDPSRCRFVPQYIGEEKLRRYPRAEGKPGVDRPLRFVYIGRWTAEKGAYLLLEAFLMSNIATEASLWVISRNADARSIRAQAEGKLTPNKSIEVLNDLSGAAVSRKLAQADVCVVPSINPETGSRAVLEAFAQGVPVIASSVVGNRYLIEDRVNGRVFEIGDEKALRRIIEALDAEPFTLIDWSKKVARPLDQQRWSSAMMEVISEAVNNVRGT